MLDYEVYVLTCAGCGEKLTLRAGQPSEVQHCPKCEMELVIDWRPDDRSAKTDCRGGVSHRKPPQNRVAVPPVARNGRSTVSANGHLGAK